MIKPRNARLPNSSASPALDFQRSLEATDQLLKTAEEHEGLEQEAQTPLRLLDLGPLLRSLEHADTPVGEALQTLTAQYGQVVYPSPGTQARMTGQAWTSAMALPTAGGVLLLTSPDPGRLCQVQRSGEALILQPVTDAAAVGGTVQHTFTLAGEHTDVLAAPAEWANLARASRTRARFGVALLWLLATAFLMLSFSALMHMFSSEGVPSFPYFLLVILASFAGVVFFLATMCNAQNIRGPFVRAFTAGLKPRLRDLARTLPAPVSRPSTTDTDQEHEHLEQSISLDTQVAPEVQHRLLEVHRGLKRTGQDALLGASLSRLVEARQLAPERNAGLDALMDAPLRELEARIEEADEARRVRNRQAAAEALSRQQPGQSNLPPATAGSRDTDRRF